MKFTAAILSIFAVGALAAVPPKGSAARESLLRAATQLENNQMMTPRKLSDDFQLSGDHSIQFQSCVSLTTEPYDNDLFYNQYNVQAAQSGQLKSQNSYIVFNACETNKCSYRSNDNVFMVDLRTYVRATMPYYPTKKSRYCTVCQMSEEYCEQMYEQKREYQNYQQQQQQQYYEQQQQQQQNYNQYQNQGDQQQQQQQEQDYNQYYQNGGGRNLQNNGYNGYNYGQYQQQDNAQAYDNNYGGQNQYQNQYQQQDADDYIVPVTCDQCAENMCFDEDFYQQQAEAAQEQGQYYQYGGQDQQQQYQNQYQYQQQQGGQQGYYNQDDVDQEALSEWLYEISSCMETDYQYNGANLYAGFICNQDGSGVEIGMFIDPYCSMYTTQISFRNALLAGGDGDTAALVYASTEAITYPFLNDIDCFDTLSYATPWGAYNEGGYYTSEPPSQYCTNLFQANSVMLNDCDSNGENDSYQAGYAYANYNGQDNDQYQNYNFYSYMLSQQDMQNYAKVCQTVKKMRGEYNTVYDSSQGNMFDYSQGNRKRTNNSSVQVFDGERRGLKMFGLITGFAIALVAIAFFIKDFCCFGSDFDSKRETLVIDGDKAYAREM